MGNTFHSTARQIRVPVSSPKPTPHPTIIMYKTLIVALSLAAYASAYSHLSDGEIDAWFTLVDTDSSTDVTAGKLDAANRVFDAKCNLPEQVEAEAFFEAGDANNDGVLSEQELDDDFHSYGELVAGETHSYFELLDTNRNEEIDLDEMRAGVQAGREQCVVLRMIDAEHFSQADCFDGEAVDRDAFGACLHTLEVQARRRR